MGIAFASTLRLDESFTTLELKINFLRPVWNGLLRAEAGVVSRGRTVGLVECKITDEKDKLIARATSTCMVLAGETAKNRGRTNEENRALLLKNAPAAFDSQYRDSRT
jgi:acyl-coenzyme A thioesterase PaaI-like protein